MLHKSIGSSRLSILLRMCQFYSTFCPLPRDIRSLAPASVTGACFVFLSVSRFRSAADASAATDAVGVIFVRCYNTKSGKEKEKHIIIICYACHLSRCWRQLQSNSANLLNADKIIWSLLHLDLDLLLLLGKPHHFSHMVHFNHLQAFCTQKESK